MALTLRGLLLASGLAFLILSGSTQHANDDDQSKSISTEALIARVVAPRPEGHWSWDNCSTSPILFEAQQALPPPEEEVVKSSYLFDDSRNNHRGSLLNGVACTAGRIGIGGQFDGIDDRVDIPAHARFDAQTALSVAAWVNAWRLTGSQTIMARPGSWSLTLEGSSFAFSVFFPDGGAGRVVTLLSPAPLNTWVQVAAVFDGGTMSLYQNGILSARRTAVGTLRRSTSPINFGNQPVPSKAFLGNIDEIRFYNRVLTQSQVSLLFNRVNNDADGDLILTDVDNCEGTSNGSQIDSDGDGIGDVCDWCPLDPENDRDGDGQCNNGLCEASCQKFLSCIARGGSPSACNTPCSTGGNPCESSFMAQQRHQRVALRRAGRMVFAHRGTWEFAKENTVEAVRATFELGADGNEFDLRKTRDGVLVAFHDDMLDFQLKAFGDVSDYTREELQRFPFRDPDRFGVYTRIPTIAEVFDIHRRYGGIMYLDVKTPGIGPDIVQLLNVLDMWDHVGGAGAPEVTSDPRFAPINTYDLVTDNRDVDPAAISGAVSSTIPGIFTDDPRGTLLALGRCLGSVSSQPHRLRSLVPNPGAIPPEADLVSIIQNAPDWNILYSTQAGKDMAAQQITARAMAADLYLKAGYGSTSGFCALDLRTVQRSLHQSWRWMGLDGQIALGALLDGNAPGAVARAREVVFRDDPILDKVLTVLRIEDPTNPFLNLPRAWLDWREKWFVWFGLQRHASDPDAARICRDMLFGLSDSEIQRLALEVRREPATIALLSLSPTTATGVQLICHPKQVVRGQAILVLLKRSNEQWAYDALVQAAPYAIPWIVHPAP